MKDLKFIKSFVFDFAQYYLEDESGNRIVLKINYKENNYNVYGLDKAYSREFGKEVNELAKSLLGRKSGINRAKAIKL
jgi:hypothetical protein